MIFWRLFNAVHAFSVEEQTAVNSYCALSISFVDIVWFNLKKSQMIFWHPLQCFHSCCLFCSALLLHASFFFHFRFKQFFFVPKLLRNGDDATMIWYCIPIRLVCAMKKKLKWISSWEMAWLGFHCLSQITFVAEVQSLFSCLEINIQC